MAKDADLIRAAMADVVPLKSRRGAWPAAATVARKPGAREADARKPGPPAGVEAGAKPVARSARRTGLPSGRQPASFSFDRDIDRALGRGRRSPEATLDLHGMTLAAAERAVSRFLEEAAVLGLRVVLIVTGKGLRRQDGRMFGGRIRAEFPGWLQRADNRARVRGLKAAHPRHGGDGAFYVLLRRP
jgi:DNA-nicking Smr family endonuclease